MIRNVLLLAGRRLRRETWFSLVNIVGLAAGLAATFVLLDVITHETSYDRYPGSERTYRIAYESTFGRVETLHARGPSALVPALDESLPLVESAAALIGRQDVLVAQPQGAVELGKALYASEDVFDLFPQIAIHGALATALSDPGAVVLTQATAERLFGNTDVVGETLELANGKTFTVTAVLGTPLLSHLTFDALFAMPPRLLEVWNGFVVLTYVRLRPGADPEAFQASVEQYIRENAPGQRGEMMTPFLQKVEGIHLTSRLEGEAGQNGSAQSVWILALAAALTLLMAVSNYVNLASLRIARRVGEVGVRKAVGATRSQVRGQFLMESVLLAAAAVPVALLLYALLKPVLFVGAPGEPVGGLALHQLAGLAIGAAGIVGVAAGAYPAFLLSVISPHAALRGGGAPRQGLHVRRLLMGVQFTVTLVFLLTALVVALQIQFIASKDLGYDPDRVAFARLWERLSPEQFETLAREMERIPEVASVSYGQLPGIQTGGFHAEAPDGRSLLVHRYIIGPGYTDALGIEMALGESFQEDDPAGFLVNETAVRHLALDDPLEERLEVDGFDLPIVGVMKDFHFFSLHDPVPPIYARAGSAGSNLIVRTTRSWTPELADRISAVWEQHGTAAPFAIRGLATKLGTEYREEVQLSRLLTTFGIVAALIAFMGLFTMVSYVMTRRRRELSIRRILGASQGHLTWIIGAESVVVFGLASAAAVGLAVIVGRAWLDGFAFRIGFPIIATCLLLLTVLATTVLLSLYHVSSESSQNPAVVLRDT